jgi:rubrerythrin
METQELIEMLKEAAQADVDAVHTYNRVLDHIADEVVRSRLMSFRDNHLEHIDAVSAGIRSLGGTPPPPTMDFKGRLVEAVAIVRTATGSLKSALRALSAAEEIANRRYAGIVSKKVPADVKDLLRKHYSDEKIHLDYITENLKVL